MAFNGVKIVAPHILPSATYSMSKLFSFPTFSYQNCFILFKFSCAFCLYYKVSLRPSDKDNKLRNNFTIRLGN